MEKLKTIVKIFRIYSGLIGIFAGNVLLGILRWPFLNEYLFLDEYLIIGVTITCMMISLLLYKIFWREDEDDKWFIPDLGVGIYIVVDFIRVLGEVL